MLRILREKIYHDISSYILVTIRDNIQNSRDIGRSVDTIVDLDKLSEIEGKRFPRMCVLLHLRSIHFPRLTIFRASKLSSVSLFRYAN